MHAQRPRRPPFSANALFATIAALITLSFGYQLGGYPLLDPDEGRNAEIAREMAVTNEFVVPHLNGIPYLDKPALYFAAEAISMKALGTNEVAARLPSLVFTLATLVLIWFFGSSLYGARGGWIAAIATGSMPLTLGFARTAIFDSALTFFVVLSILSFHRAVEGAADENRWMWTAVAWGAIGFGVLTKGPIALGLPLFVATPYALWRRRPRAVFDAVAIFLFVAIILPWVLAVMRTEPELLRYALGTETAERFFTANLQRSGPWWYFFPIVIAGSLPWSLIALFGYVRNRTAVRTPAGTIDPRVVYWIVWIVAPLLFFTLSNSKRPQYVLPVIPAFAFLVSHLVIRHNGSVPRARLASAILCALGGIVLVAPHILPTSVPVTKQTSAAIAGVALGLGLVTLMAGVLGLFFSRRPAVVLLAFSLPVISIPFVSQPLMRAIGSQRSAAELAAAIQSVRTPDTEIIGIEAFPLSLPFYLRTTLILSTADASELTSNYIEETYERRLTEGYPTFRSANWWLAALNECTKPRVFVVRRDDHPTREVLDQRVPLRAENRKYAAYGPCISSRLALAGHSRGQP